MASYNESAEILRNATETGQGFERRQVEAMNRQQIGRILSAMRRWKEAKLAFEESIAAFQRLRKDDPLNVACQRGLAGRHGKCWRGAGLVNGLYEVIESRSRSASCEADEALANAAVSQKPR